MQDIKVENFALTYVLVALESVEVYLWFVTDACGFVFFDSSFYCRLQIIFGKNNMRAMLRWSVWTSFGLKVNTCNNFLLIWCCRYYLLICL